jgi:hypothetical protein
MRIKEFFGQFKIRTPEEAHQEQINSIYKSSQNFNILNIICLDLKKKFPKKFPSEYQSRYEDNKIICYVNVDKEEVYPYITNVNGNKEEFIVILRKKL